MSLRYSLMFFTGMGAAACALFGVQEYSLSARSSQEPEEISLHDLIKRGPEGNPNIILTDFSLFEDYIYEKKALSGDWTKVWVPIVPANGDEKASGKPAAIRAFLFSEDIHSDAEVRQRFDRPKLRGMVNPEAPKPGIIGRVLIRENYPGTEPSNCIIIEEGKEPASPLKLGLFGLGFVGLSGLTGGIWYMARKGDETGTRPRPGDKDRRGRRHGKDPEPISDPSPVDDTGHRPRSHDRREQNGVGD